MSQRRSDRAAPAGPIAAARAGRPILPGGAHPGLLSGVFGTLVPAATLSEGGYVQLAGETGWWIPSGRIYLSPGDTDTPVQELANARAHFFLACRAVDPFGAISRATSDAYSLLVASATDPVGNVITAANDYRVLKPATVTDANGNRTGVAFDAFGLVTATAVMGKTTETKGDLLTGLRSISMSRQGSRSSPTRSPLPPRCSATRRRAPSMTWMRISVQAAPRSRRRPPSIRWRAKLTWPI